MLDAIGSSAHLEVDGGVKASNVAEVTGAGADVIIAGSAVFGGSESVEANVKAIMNAW
jgi:ribulose-phosphate 3-epimerase